MDMAVLIVFYVCGQRVDTCVVHPITQRIRQVNTTVADYQLILCQRILGISVLSEVHLLSKQTWMLLTQNSNIWAYQQSILTVDELLAEFLRWLWGKEIFKYCKIFNWHICFFIPDLLLSIGIIQMDLVDICYRHKISVLSDFHYTRTVTS